MCSHEDFEWLFICYKDKVYLSDGSIQVFRYRGNGGI